MAAVIINMAGHAGRNQIVGVTDWRVVLSGIGKPFPCPAGFRIKHKIFWTRSALKFCFVPSKRDGLFQLWQKQRRSCGVILHANSMLVTQFKTKVFRWRVLYIGKACLLEKLSLFYNYQRFLLAPLGNVWVDFCPTSIALNVRWGLHDCIKFLPIHINLRGFTIAKT